MSDAALEERTRVVRYLRSVARASYEEADSISSEYPETATAIRRNGDMAEVLAYEIDRAYHLDPEKFRLLGVTKY